MPAISLRPRDRRQRAPAPSASTPASRPSAAARRRAGGSRSSCRSRRGRRVRPAQPDAAAGPVDAPLAGHEAHSPIVAVGRGTAPACRGRRLAPRGQAVEIRIHYSHFLPRADRARRRPITFVLVNEDPIDHEWIVGDAASTSARTGTDEPQHGADGVSIPALGTVETTVTFAEPGKCTSATCPVTRPTGWSAR